jgi:hypothetical protein
MTCKLSFRFKNFPDSLNRMFSGISQAYPSYGTKAMHGVNLDLLHASSPHHPDGRPKDPHAHHRSGHIAARRALRRDWWQRHLAVWLRRLRRASVIEPVARPCTDQTP